MGQSMEREWTQEEIDDQMDSEPDVCHHGVGFDETCEWCEVEIAEEERVEREKNKPQGDIFGHATRV
jgi:hypothetical protein